MRNFDVTSIVKCHIVPEGRLKETQIMFLDYLYKDDKPLINISQDSSYPPTMGLQVYTKKLIDEKIKTLTLYQTTDLFEEILNYYHDMYMEGQKTSPVPAIVWDEKIEDHRKLLSRTITAGSTVAIESRRGPANVYVVPNEKYATLLSQVHHQCKIIINPTESHKDKIFAIRVDTDSSAPGLSLFLNRNLMNDRYMKLVKIMNKMGKNIDDMSFSYILTTVGFNAERFVRCIYLIEN